MSPRVVRVRGASYPSLVLREVSDFGISALDLLRPPARFWSDGEPAPPAWSPAYDAAQSTAEPSPGDLLEALPPGDTWLGQSRRSLARLLAWLLVVEDPQRRLEVRSVTPLAHQASLVQHVLTDPKLRSVLIADEVGLGKTIEAALIIERLLQDQPSLRVLYLAPASLVANVREELRRVGLTQFRSWVAGPASNALLDEDRHIIASIHRAVNPANFDKLKKTRWDVIVVDECHHLSAYGTAGSASRRKFRLVEELRRLLPAEGRLILMSGTPHQGHQTRFENLLSLLRRDGEQDSNIAGRVIYRTKEDVRDWHGRRLFPGRDVRPPVILELTEAHRAWLKALHDLFRPADGAKRRGQDRAVGWRAAQALQWGTSSIEAGLGYLARQAARAGWDPRKPEMLAALLALRPYRSGTPDEDPWTLFERIQKEIGHQAEVGDLQDIEEDDEEVRWRPNAAALARALKTGCDLLQRERHRKWDALFAQVLDALGEDKVVLFAQPIETVTALARDIARRTGKKPAVIIGGQSEQERRDQIRSFWQADGPRFLVSSRAGGEGLNLQIARHLVHVDVPWNPMEMEQRVGRIHRFLSRRTVVVHTLVVADSREKEMYEVARTRLRQIASDLAGTDERLQALFSRVMALVPPEELQDVLSREAVGPMSASDRSTISELVSTGFEQWRSFHDRYTQTQNQMRSVPAGIAGWGDLARLVEDHLSGKPASGYATLSFEEDGADVSAVRRAAAAYDVQGQHYALGDLGGMPVVATDGSTITGLGTNVTVVQTELRRLGFPTSAAGAAHVRWPDGHPLPAHAHAPFGMLVLARLPYRLANGVAQEMGGQLHVFLVTAEGSTELSEVRDKELAIRGLLSATSRQRPDDLPALIKTVRLAEASRVNELRTFVGAEREHHIFPAVVPLLAAIVS